MHIASRYILMLLTVCKCTVSGLCPNRCRHDQVCEDAECPYDGCQKGWWGRTCEYALECLIPGDNGVHYRGTQNTTSDGTPCDSWVAIHHAVGEYLTPADGPHHNYCRYIPDYRDLTTWCYTSRHGNPYGTCSIPICTEHCPPPRLENGFVLELPSTGFIVGTRLTIVCLPGFNNNGHSIITCKPDKQWSTHSKCEALECLLPGDNGVHYRGTQSKAHDGTTCHSWDLIGNNSITPSVGFHHNYCRHIPDVAIQNTWCYTTQEGTEYKQCTISTCDGYCTIPPTNGSITELPRTGLYIGIQIKIQCEIGYSTSLLPVIVCGSDLKWKPEPAEICQRCPDNLYGVNCSSSCNCDQRYTESCNHVTGMCNCIQGRTGNTCSEDENECETNVGICGDNSQCINTDGYFTCECHKGYRRIRGQCQAVHCVKLPYLEVGSTIRNTKSVYMHNDTLEVVCDPGYTTLQGTNVTYLNCEEDGSWSASGLLCRALCPSKCKMTADCSNTTDQACPYGECQPGWWGRHCEYPLECLSKNISHYRGTMNITAFGKACLRWDTLSDQYEKLLNDKHTENYCRHLSTKPEHVWCFTEGKKLQWCEVPSCEQQCSPPDLSIHSVLDRQPLEGFAIGTSIAIRCDQEYVPTEVQTLTCLPGMKWSNQSTICTEQQCNPPDLSMHSILDRQLLEGFAIGTSIAIRCVEGYVPTEVQTLTCLPGMKWSNQSTICTAICSDPKTVPNIIVVNERPKYLLNDTIVIRCDPGYDLQGENQFVCQENGIWSGTMPKCINSSQSKDQHNVTIKTMALVGIISGSALCVLLMCVALIVVFTRRRRNLRLQPECTTDEAEMPDVHHYETLIQSQRAPPDVNIYSEVTLE